MGLVPRGWVVSKYWIALALSSDTCKTQASLANAALTLIQNHVGFKLDFWETIRMVDIHSFQLDIWEKGNKHAGKIFGEPLLCFLGIYSTHSFPPYFLFFPWETEDNSGWVGLSYLLRMWIVPSHSILTKLLHVNWVDGKGVDKAEKKRSKVHTRGQGWRWQLGFLCSLNGEDHFYGNLFLLLRKRKTLVHHIKKCSGTIWRMGQFIYSSASGLKTKFKST